jgi:hypothetical protein
MKVRRVRDPLRPEGSRPAGHSPSLASLITQNTDYGRTKEKDNMGMPYMMVLAMRAGGNTADLQGSQK